MEKAVLVEVDEPLSLFLKSRRKAISVGLIVFEFGIDKVVNLEHIIQKCSKGRTYGSFVKWMPTFHYRARN